MATTTHPEGPNEIELLMPPDDGITSMKIKENRYLLVSSWDSQVRLYDISSNTLKTSYKHNAAVLDCSFLDKNSSYSGGLDKTIKLFEFTTNTERTIGTHEKAVRCVNYNAELSLLVTGSWDATTKVWDSRSSNSCIGTYRQPERVYTMDMNGHTLIVGTAKRHVFIYDLRNMKEPTQRRESSLKNQTRSIRCFIDGSGYALASIEGRVAMEYLDPSPEAQAKKYAFKCHRSTLNGIDTVYPVNCLEFHPKYGTFASGGCDGIVNMWDGHNKKRLFQFTRYPTSISALAFSEDGNSLAIASSYTFEEGEKEYFLLFLTNHSHPPDQIFIRSVTEAEVAPKSKTQ